MRRIGFLPVLLLSAFPLGACSTREHTDSASANETAQTCSDEQSSQALSAMVNGPIMAGRSYGSVDIIGGNGWKGLTIDEIKRTLCAPTEDAEVNGEQVASWGSPTGGSNVFQLTYDKTSRKVSQFVMNVGYRGKLEFKSRPNGPYGQHTYSFGVGIPSLRDGRTWELDWSHIGPQVNEIYDGVLATFAPELPATPDCVASRDCRAARTPDGQAAWGVRPLGIYFAYPAVSIDQPGPSTPNMAYGFVVKSLPGSRAQGTLKLDDEGPVFVATGLGDRHTTCTMKLGVTYQSYVDDCVRVLASSAASDLVQQKLEGSVDRVITGSTGTWLLDIVGARPSFASERFDETKPIPSAAATELVLDARTPMPLNEYTNGVRTLAGTSAIYVEYARLAQAAALEGSHDARHPFGDSACETNPQPGCTGLESFIAPGPTSAPGTTESPQIVSDRNFYFGSAMAPGNLSTPFFGDDDNEYSLFKATQARLVRVLGHGDANAIPEKLRNPLFFVNLWAQALVHTLGAAPAEGDIVIKDLGDGALAVLYKNKLQIDLDLDGNISRMTFRH